LTSSFIATAESKYWPSEGTLIFANGWLLPSSEVQMNIKNVLVTPTVNEKQELFELSNKIYESTLDEIVRVLNTYHTTLKSRRYWEIIVGVWLRMFIESVATRTLIVQSVLKNDKDTNIVVSSDSLVNCSPQCLQDFQADLKSVSWNAGVYSNIFDILNANHSQNTFTSNLMTASSPLICDNFGPSYLSSTYLPRLQEFLLAMKLGSIPHRIKQIQIPVTNSDEKIRTLRLNTFEDGNTIENVVSSLTLRYMPHSYLEGFSFLIDRISLEFPKKPPRSVFTANRHIYDDAFNIWVAEMTERGSKLVLAQHGGYFGASRFASFAERHELSVADRYLTWGWSSSPVCTKAFVLTQAGVKPRKKARGTNLVVVTDHVWSHPRSFFLDLAESGNYLSFMAQIIHLLDASVKSTTLLRIHHGHDETGSPQDVWWNDHAPNIKQDDGKVPFSTLLPGAKLILTSHNGTTFPETISAGIPTIIAWDESFVALRPETEHVFHSLEQAGVFHRTPESAASFINSIWDDVDGWWSSPATLEARKHFTDQYARTVSHPVRFLAKALQF
jgi:putative transferase (TIGR04331 family)